MSALGPGNPTPKNVTYRNGFKCVLNQIHENVLSSTICSTPELELLHTHQQ